MLKCLKPIDSNCMKSRDICIFYDVYFYLKDQFLYIPQLYLLIYFSVITVCLNVGGHTTLKTYMMHSYGSCEIHELWLADITLEFFLPTNPGQPLRFRLAIQAINVILKEDCAELDCMMMSLCLWCCRFLSEVLKPLVKTEFQLLYIYHLVGPFLQRFQQERTRCMLEVHMRSLCKPVPLTRFLGFPVTFELVSVACFLLWQLSKQT